MQCCFQTLGLVKCPRALLLPIGLKKGRCILVRDFLACVGLYAFEASSLVYPKNWPFKKGGLYQVRDFLAGRLPSCLEAF